MAFKRQIDRLPIIPADAKKQNVTCHFCIVGCGYHAYTWPVNKQGATNAAQNVFKTDLSKQQGPETEAWYSPSMYNIVQQDGKDVHIVITPDKACEVNSGLVSISRRTHGRDELPRARATQQQRLTSNGLPLWPNAAHVTGRRTRPRRARQSPCSRSQGVRWINLFVPAFSTTAQPVAAATRILGALESSSFGRP
jgi:hypothetical protein